LFAFLYFTINTIYAATGENIAFYRAWSFVHSSRGKAGKAEGILKAVLTSLQVKCGESSTEFAHALQGLGYAYQNLRLYEESQ